MDPLLLEVFHGQIQIQAKGALLSYQAAVTELNAARVMTPSGPAHRIDMDWFWINIQGCLGAIANISKACWGNGSHASDRASLRASLGLTDDSPLADRSMRNNFEHLDERLYKWWKTRTSNDFVDLSIGPSGEIPVNDNDIFRFFDLRTHEVVFLGSRYPLRAIMPEVRALWLRTIQESN